MLLYNPATGDERIFSLAEHAGHWESGPVQTFAANQTLTLGDFAASPYTPTPTPSPSPTPTPSPTLSPKPSKTPSPTPSPTPVTTIQGDVNCDGAATLADAKDLLAFGALEGGQPTGCLSDVSSQAGHVFGDVNCNGAVDVVDALDILLHIAGDSEIQLVGGCPLVGQPLT